MALPVFVPQQYESAFGLLGCMASELASAFRRAGAEVNPERSLVAGEARVYVFFNFPADMKAFQSWCRPDVPGAVLLHVFVDHPFALATDVMDALAALPCYRLLLPCIDDRHLLALRWPKIRTLTMPHAVEVPESGADRLVLGDRPFDVVLAGSVASQPEILAARERIPSAVREAADEAIEFLATSPAASFSQAFDACMPSGLSSSDGWGLMRLVWSYVTPAVNRRRRLAIVNSMKGLRTRVLGSKAWAELCDGTIEYGGDIAYKDLVSEFASAKVAVAWNPTQFVLTHSERVLLSMAGGCATVTDDRPSMRRAFGGNVPAAVISTTDAVAGFRPAVERVLGSKDLMNDLSTRGEAAVRSSQHWDHRMPIFAAAIESVLVEARAAANP